MTFGTFATIAHEVAKNSDFEALLREDMDSALARKGIALGADDQNVLRSILDKRTSLSALAKATDPFPEVEWPAPAK